MNAAKTSKTRVVAGVNRIPGMQSQSFSPRYASNRDTSAKTANRAAPQANAILEPGSLNSQIETVESPANCTKSNIGVCWTLKHIKSDSADASFITKITHTANATNWTMQRIGQCTKWSAPPYPLLTPRKLYFNIRGQQPMLARLVVT